MYEVHQHRFRDQRHVYSGFGQDFWVGRHGNNKSSYDFQGNLDELRIYNRVLSEVEIQALAQGSQE